MASQVSRTQTIGRLVPRRISGAPSTRVGITAGFFLGEIDGVTSLEELADVINVSMAAAVLSVGELIEKRLVHPDAMLEAAYALAKFASEEGTLRASRVPAFDAATSAPAASSAPAPAALAPAVPAPKAARTLSAEERLKILKMYQVVALSDHYSVLGLPRDAEPAAVRKAYLSRIGACHPDRYYGRDLGDVHGMLEKIFARVTAAFETLDARHPAAKKRPAGAPAVNLPLADRKRALAARLSGARPRMSA